MNRRRPEELTLNGPDVEAVVRYAADPLDFSLMGPMDFLPARAYISAVGHLVRTYEADDHAWVRELAFDFELRSLTINGPADALDMLEFELPRLRSGDPAGVLRTFYFQDKDSDGELRYETDGLYVMSGDKVNELFALDVAEKGHGHLATHRVIIEEACRRFFGRRLNPRLSVTVGFSFVPYGLAYDLSGKQFSRYRSPIERGFDEPPQRRGLMGLLRRGAPMPSTDTAAGLAAAIAVRTHRRREGDPTITAEGLTNLLERHRASGGQVWTKATFRGSEYAYVLVSGDGERLATISETAAAGLVAAAWRVSGWEAISRAELLTTLAGGRALPDRA